MTNDLGTGGVGIVRRKIDLPARGAIGLRLMSDLHVGSPNVDYDAIRRELADAKRRGDRILLNGDIFDAIVASDPRYMPTLALNAPQSPIDSREGFGSDDALNVALDASYAILRPVIHLIDYIGTGNHERTILKRAGIDLTRLLVDRLNADGGRVALGGYCSFIDYRLQRKRDDSSRDTPGEPSARYTIFAHHGSGHGKGSIASLNRFNFVDADLVWIGHHHNRIATGHQILSCPRSGGVQLREVRQVMTGAYMQAYCSNGRQRPRDNYASIAGYVPGSIGGARVTLRLTADGLSVEVSQ